MEAPIGCAPHECYGVYEPFFSRLDDYAERVSKDPVAGCRQYLEDYYYAPKSWSDYLSQDRHGGRARCLPPRQERAQ